MRNPLRPPVLLVGTIPLVALAFLAFAVTALPSAPNAPATSGDDGITVTCANTANDVATNETNEVTPLAIITYVALDDHGQVLYAANIPIMLTDDPAGMDGNGAQAMNSGDPACGSCLDATAAKSWAAGTYPTNHLGKTIDLSIDDFARMVLASPTRSYVTTADYGPFKLKFDDSVVMNRALAANHRSTRPLGLKV